VLVKNCINSIILGLGLVLAISAHAQDSTEPAGETPDVQQDVIILKNGSKILGTVTSARDGSIVVSTDFAGDISIDSSEVESVRTFGSLVVQMADGRIIEDQPIEFDDSGMEITTDSGEQTVYSTTDIALINPEPWELGDGYKAWGDVSFAWGMERGNSDTDELDYRMDAYWRSLRDRYTVMLNGDVDKANGAKNTDNWRIIGKYDRFLEGPHYWGILTTFEQDEFADLDLRAYIGPYYGRQFFDKPAFSLSTEVGLSYVSENFITAEDQKYPGANWNIQINSNKLGGGSNMYLDHVGIWNLKDTSDLILNTRMGVTVPLIYGFQGGVEIKLEYDSGAVEGVKELDQTYKIRFGYAW
jgi:putative salt-induced outer membrane protein YdiY